MNVAVQIRDAAGELVLSPFDPGSPLKYEEFMLGLVSPTGCGFPMVAERGYEEWFIELPIRHGKINAVFIRKAGAEPKTVCLARSLTYFPKSAAPTVVESSDPKAAYFADGILLDAVNLASVPEWIKDTIEHVKEFYSPFFSCSEALSEEINRIAQNENTALAQQVLDELAERMGRKPVNGSRKASFVLRQLLSKWSVMPRQYGKKTVFGPPEKAQAEEFAELMGDPVPDPKKRANIKTKIAEQKKKSETDFAG